MFLKDTKEDYSRRDHCNKGLAGKERPAQFRTQQAKPIDTCHGHLPSTSTKIKSCASAAAGVQHPLKGVQSLEKKWGILCSGGKLARQIFG